MALRFGNGNTPPATPGRNALHRGRRDLVCAAGWEWSQHADAGGFRVLPDFPDAQQ